MKYAFIGAGKMASAIIRGMLRSRMCEPSDIIASCPDPELLKALQNATSVNITSSNAKAAAEAPVIILCVKPGDAAPALRDIETASREKLLISIIAGLPISTLKSLAPQCRIIRAMPNTAAMVGRSATAFATKEDISSSDHEIAKTIFSSIGAVFSVEEKLLDAVTGLSGAGPAYVYLVIEALSDGGVAAGLPRKLALDLAIQTLTGAAEMAATTTEHPATLREMVTSPGGATIVGLAELERRAVRAAFIEAVRTATKRAQELSGDS